MTRAFHCTVGVLLCLASAKTASAPECARAFLASVFKTTSDDIERVNAGHVVARNLSVHDPREIATLGVVRMRVTPEFYAQQLSDIVNFKRDAAVFQIGRFSDPPTLADVAGLTLDPWDVAKLRECRAWDCGVQLPADAIDRFRRDIDWRRADAETDANRLMRQILVDYVTRYREGGAAASMRYADRPEPVDLAQQFSALVEADADTWRHFAGLRHHLLHYPTAHSPRITDIVYWSKERVGRRVVVSVTHLAIWRVTDGPVAYAIASKQVYGTHYFDASLGLTVLLSDQTTATPAMYVVYLNRSRVDVFKGMFGGIARRIVNTRARSLVSEQLARLQRSLEHQFAAASR